MVFEKTQKGNPHALTVRQHIFPNASIARFTKNDGCVSVWRFSVNQSLECKPQNHIFCAKRIWDQRAEDGYMKVIEDRFQSLADAIVQDSYSIIGFFEKSIINDFYALWNIRAHVKGHPVSDQAITNALKLAYNPTKDEQELLERNNITTIRPNLTIPGRHLAGINIQMNLNKVRKQLGNARWGILKAERGEFIVPDNFSNARILPISPTICLFADSKNAIIPYGEVTNINQLAIASSTEYFFARKFSECPV
jgi:hypothetical protein